jgi:hypothetical protein
MTNMEVNLVRDSDGTMVVRPIRDLTPSLTGAAAELISKMAEEFGSVCSFPVNRLTQDEEAVWKSIPGSLKVKNVSIHVHPELSELNTVVWLALSKNYGQAPDPMYIVDRGPERTRE